MNIMRTRRIFPISLADFITVRVTIDRLDNELIDFRLRNALTTRTIIKALLPSSVSPELPVLAIGNIAVARIRVTTTKSSRFQDTYIT
jgi:hypothetical protein